ncbi:MAG: histidine kinase [Bacteroidales bacterium]|nr:histidine kinase [Bacteroidales bacterium]
MTFSEKIKNIDYKRIAYHILFWSVVTVSYDAVSSFIYDRPFLQTLLHDIKYYTPTDMLGVYFMLYFLIPKFLLNKEYLKFSLFSFLFFFILIFIATLPFQYFGHFVDYTDFYLAEGKPFPTFESFVYKNFVQALTVKLMLVGIASSIKIAKVWVKSQKRQQNLLKEKLEINLQLKEAELKFLKSQINPHFLFNSLNNLYSLTLEKSPKAPEVVLKISSLLDYMLYKCNVPSIELDNEIENIRNYIDIQKIRYGNDTNIEIDIKGDTSNIKIAPLLILPIVENAFKHGLDKNVGRGYIKILIEVAEYNEFHLSVRNSLRGENNHNGEGIGMKNLKKRLELQYPEKFILSVKFSDNEYKTVMRLNLT